MLASHTISVQTEDLDKKVRYTKIIQNTNLSKVNGVADTKQVSQVFNLKTGRFRIIGC
ncbi:hypothetical protein LEP1GSC194_0307 [Leptospira alstonii serovar Sichuan str. 79601]|uniref:Uncharacterized protein n=1 Tax=Leptospira alstonii serovar Sichuan str. 79601 TaxID=1218565 RepID=M6CVQ3_9LEPT|nr:hypothetical protein LEP1GSC194_0307 [Leptospira alstonii serovar Sichuan str. 79601]